MSTVLLPASATATCDIVSSCDVVGEKVTWKLALAPASITASSAAVETARPSAPPATTLTPVTVTAEPLPLESVTVAREVVCAATAGEMTSALASETTSSPDSIVSVGAAAPRARTVMICSGCLASVVTTEMVPSAYEPRVSVSVTAKVSVEPLSIVVPARLVRTMLIGPLTTAADVMSTAAPPVLAMPTVTVYAPFVPKGTTPASYTLSTTATLLTVYLARLCTEAEPVNVTRSTSLSRLVTKST